MNVTFLIGNGFDLNLGLGTGFKAFLKYYLKKEAIDPQTQKKDDDIEAFKRLISADIDYWSALEKALGEMTNISPLNNADGLIKCKRDLDRCLREYLILQQARVEYPEDKKYAQEMVNSIDGYRKFLKEATKQRISQVYNACIGESFYYNAITFNYTNVFDTCFNSMPSILNKHRKGNTEYGHQKGKLVHIHGTMDQSMIVGVNDETQIANKKLATDKRVQMHLIKPRMNELSQEMRSDEARELIRTSTIIVVFGMSIGATDKLWWKCIAQRMLASSLCQLIIIDYIPELDPAFPYEVSIAEDEAIERFLSIAEVEETQRENLRSRISAFYNTEMFKLSLTKKPLESNSASA